MGFLDALADLSPGIIAASKGLTGALQGVEDRQKRERDQAMQALAQQRQARIDEQNSLLNTARISDMQAQAAIRDQQMKASTDAAAHAKAYIDSIREKQPELAAALEGTGADPDAVAKVVVGQIAEKRAEQTAAATDARQQRNIDAQNERQQKSIDASNERLGRSIAAANERLAQQIAARGAGGTGRVTGLGSGGIGGVARTAGAISGMDVANQQMVPFEQAVLTGKANYNGLQYWTGLRAKMYDAKGVVDEGSHAAAFAYLDQKNPDLANYLRAAETWALEDSQLSGRASDFRTKLDAFVSAIGPNAGAKHIANTQQFRQNRLDVLKRFQPAMEAIARQISGEPAPAPGAPSSAGGPDPAFAARAKALRAAGVPRDKAAATLQAEGWDPTTGKRRK